jgi:hypothetical protein
VTGDAVVILSERVLDISYRLEVVTRRNRLARRGLLARFMGWLRGEVA